ILQTTDIPIPERGWSNAGLVDGRRSQVAWRMLNSQYWGVPQRRKRIFLVSDFRDRRAAKILFEPAGVRRNSAPCESKKSDIAARTRRNSDFAVYENHGQDSRIRRVGDIAPTVNAKYGTGGNNVPLVTYSIASNIIGRQLKNGGNGTGFSEKISYTLTATDRHAVAYGIGRDAFNQGANAKFNPTIVRELQPALTARGAGAVAKNVVRRLTPLECERLMGLPDNWTAGGSDAARYKAIGNGMALPIAEFILRRIKEATI
ncbi:MAG: DNA cytosine methyltransferase, partial [Selenomonadaceae bacterium]|nr:DNA cytosine methyltransferase [Selenomonadaceae bacterium]